MCCAGVCRSGAKRVENAGRRPAAVLSPRLRGTIIAANIVGLGTLPVNRFDY